MAKPGDPYQSGDYRYKNRTINFTEGDVKLIDWLCEYLGCSRSEAVRSAVRSFASQLSQIEKRSRTGA